MARERAADPAWQRALLTEMVESGVDAIMVKTAGLGLVPRLHLGRRIADLRPYLCGLQVRRCVFAGGCA